MARSGLIFCVAIAGWILMVERASAMPDLRLTLTNSPTPVSIGELLSYHFTITNQGNMTATDVTLVSTLSNATVFSISISQGAVSTNTNSVTCQLGALDAGATATIVLKATPQMIGSLTNFAGVTETESDLNLSDNFATNTTLVVPLTFNAGPPLTRARYQHTATLLPDGRVLIAGGQGSSGSTTTAEIYDPQTKTFTPTGNLPQEMRWHAATLLQDGTVLLTGGHATQSAAIIYNPTNGTFTSVSNMISPHTLHSSTLLPDGRVLISGGSGNTSAELYLPSQRGFVSTGFRITGSTGHRAFPLTNGTVAMLGGTWVNNLPPTNDLYVIATGTFISLGVANPPQNLAGGAELLDGRILLAGGMVSSSPSTAAMLYDPVTSNFTATGSTIYPHMRATATRIANGNVLIVGVDYNYVVSPAAQKTPELYDANTGTFSRTAVLRESRFDHTATILLDGTVLVAGGYFCPNFPFGGCGAMATTEIYDPLRTKAPPAVSIAAASAFEGDSGTTTLLFPVTLSSPVGLPVSVGFHTGGSNGIVTFPPGETNAWLPIGIKGDQNYEQDEVFTVWLNLPNNVVLGIDNANGTVLNDDPKPTVSVVPASVPERNVGTNRVTLNIRLTAASVEPISMNFFTSDGTATSPSDFFPTNGTLTFAPGITNLTIPIRLRPDIIIESDEIFYVHLTNVTNAIITTNQFPVTMVNDDGLPGFAHHFDLSLVPSPQHQQAPFPLTILAKDFSGGVATNFSGGVVVWGTLTNVPWLKFDFEEGDFSQWTPLNLGNQPGPYEIASFDVAGRGTPTLAFRLAANAGAADGIIRSIPLVGGVTYFVSMDLAVTNENPDFANVDPSTAHVQINSQEIGSFGFGVFGWIYPFQTFRTNITATYTASTNGIYQLALKFDRGAGQASVWSYADNVRIRAAPMSPVWLSPFTNGVWSGTVQVNGAASGLSLLVEDIEGHGGSGNAFDVEASANLSLLITNSALVRAGSDLTFTLLVTNRGPATASNVIVSNILAGDLIFRSGTTSRGTLSNIGNTVIGNVGILTNGQSVTLTITTKPHSIGSVTNLASVSSIVFDQDLLNNSAITVLTAAPPLLQIGNHSIAESSTGTNFALVQVWLEGPVGHALSLDYATTNGTALAGSDYVAVTGTLIIPPDVTTQYVTIPIRGDVTYEPNETVSLLLSNPTNASLSTISAMLTIVNDDPLPGVSVADMSFAEGNSGGSPNVVFQVTLSNPSSSEVRISCRTTNGTAFPFSDYVTTTGTLIFPAGTTNQTFSVPVFGDMANEPNQTFFVILHSPVNCSIARGTATGTILNDDAAPGRLLRFAFDSIGSPQYVGRAFPATVRALDHLDQPATFSGTVTVVAHTDEFYIQRLFDDFEASGLMGWTNYAGGLMSVSNVNDIAAVGVRSLRISGRGQFSSPAYTLRRTITNSRPNRVSFYVRAAQTNAITGRMWLVGGIYRAFEFYMNKNAQMGLYANNFFFGVPYESNRWYQVDLDLDWTAKMVNGRIDGVPVLTNIPFPEDPYSGADYIAVQNSEIGTSWFDEIHVFNSSYSNLVASPTTLSGFVGGVWNGNISVGMASSNAYLTVTDNADHDGRSGNFNVLPLSSIPRPHLKFLSPTPLTAAGLDLVLEGLSGVTYRIEASTNLATWFTITNLNSTNTVVPFRDSSANSQSEKFYRAITP
jgi:uncharacterized repeat protein (TIGR01451 family)